MAKRQPAVSLKLDGERLVVKQSSPLLRRIKAFLDAAPPDDLFTMQKLARLIPCCDSRIAHYTSSPELQGYSLPFGNRRYWGNPHAVAELRRQKENPE